MNKNLSELQILHEICAEQLRIINKSQYKFEREIAEEYYTSAFHSIIKLIKANDCNYPDGLQGSCFTEAESNKEKETSH